MCGLLLIPKAIINMDIIDRNPIITHRDRSASSSNVGTVNTQADRIRARKRQIITYMGTVNTQTDRIR